MKFAIQPVRASDLKLPLIGDDTYTANYISGLSNADQNCITFYKGDSLDSIKSSIAGILIVNSRFIEVVDAHVSKAVVFADNPMFEFAKIITKNYRNSFDIHQKVNTDDSIVISPLAYVERNVAIGENTEIYPYACIFNSTEIGSNCTIQSGSIIGGIGMAYVKHQEEYYKLVHLGNTKIGDRVDIGTNVSILRGILETTLIKDGTKIGNNVNIGHNVNIGKNCYISSGVTISGACSIGDNCWIAPGVTLVDHITVGQNTKIGVGSVLIKDALQNSFYMGNPARLISENK